MPRFEERRRFGGFREGGFRESRPILPKPVKVGEKYDVEISGVGTRGDGITKIKDFVVFVPDTKKGEKVKIEIKEVRDRFATGEKVGGAEAIEEAGEVEETVEGTGEAEEAVEEAAEEVVEEGAEEETEEVTEEVTEEITEPIEGEEELTEEIPETEEEVTEEETEE